MFRPPKADLIGFQARKLATTFRTRKVNMFSAIDKVRKQLVYGDKTDAAEDAMRVLGDLLGLESTRPDSVEKTGPDNVWSGDGEVEAWGFDLKTGKDDGSEYNKSELAQSHDHLNWLQTAKKGKQVRVSIVGRELAVSNKANPDPDLDIIDLSGFQEIASNVKKVLESVDAGDKGNLEDSFEGWLRHYGLLWPTCVLALPNKRAVELKRD